MVVEHFLGRSPDDELAIGKAMGTRPYTGTNTKGMVRYFKKIGWEVSSNADKNKTPQDTLAFKNFVLDHLNRNVPIMVENVDWGGHWRVIIGYDTMGTDGITSSDVLIMADPYDTADHLQDGYVVVPAEKFFYMWFVRICLPQATANSNGWPLSRLVDIKDESNDSNVVIKYL